MKIHWWVPSPRNIEGYEFSYPIPITTKTQNAFNLCFLLLGTEQNRQQITLAIQHCWASGRGEKQSSFEMVCRKKLTFDITIKIRFQFCFHHIRQPTNVSLKKSSFFPGQEQADSSSGRRPTWTPAERTCWWRRASCRRICRCSWTSSFPFDGRESCRRCRRKCPNKRRWFCGSETKGRCSHSCH